jgi:hypothetical protein
MIPRLIANDDILRRIEELRNAVAAQVIETPAAWLV